MKHYLIFIYRTKVVNRVIRALKRNGRIRAIVIVAELENTSAIGGIRNIDRDNIAITQGYMPLIEPST